MAGFDLGGLYGLDNSYSNMNTYGAYGSNYADALGVNSSAAEKLENKLNGIGKDTTDEELMEACKSFESYMVEQVIKASQATIHTEEDEGEYFSMFKDQLYQSYAQMITDSGSLGLAQQFYDNIKSHGLTS